jgi:hypothetical protein
MTEPTIVGTFLAGERTVGYSYSGAPWIVSVRLAGVELELADVLADVTIRHGRTEAGGEPQASSASLALWPVDGAFTRAFRVGVELELVGVSPAGAWPLFRGVVSDAVLDDPTLSIVAAGVLASANRVELPIADWPEEPWSARAARLFAATPFAGLVEPDPDFDPVLAPPTNLNTGTILFATYATSLAASVGAAIVDTPDGRLRAQALGSRRGATVHELDPAIVAWAPKWLQPLDVVNVIELQYGPDDATASIVDHDQASIDLYGRRATSIQTTRIKSAGDAATRCRTALDRAAYPRWSMRDVVLLEPIANLAIGDRVLLTELPASAPSSDWAPLVEGWTHTISGPDWTLSLSLSDPTSSGLALPWQDVPAGAWQDVPPLQWLEADSPTDFD